MLYPSDSNEVYPGRYLTADYSDPGQIVEFTSSGRLLRRMGGFNQPSLALPLPNGDILLNDDFNHRVCVVDPATHRIVWQYGHTGASPASGPGYLSDPDGVDLVPPDSLLVTHAATMARSVGPSRGRSLLSRLAVRARLWTGFPSGRPAELSRRSSRDMTPHATLPRGY